MSDDPIHILLVEDDPDHAALAARSFEERPDRFRLEVAHTLAEARQSIPHRQPGLLIADVKLPDGKGLDLLGDDATDLPYPVLIVTSQGDEEVAVEAMRRGAIDYVVKSEAMLAGLSQAAERCLSEWARREEQRRQDEAIRLSEARLAEAQRVAHIGHWDWDIPTGKIAWSDETYRIFGFAPGELDPSYDTFLERVHPDDREAVGRAVQRALEAGETYGIDHRVVLPNDTVRVISEQGIVERGENGKPLRMLGTAQDVTELEVVQTALSHTSELLEKIFSSIHVHIAYLDTSFRFIRVNAAYALSRGREPDDFVGENLFELYPDDRYRTVYERVIESGVPYFSYEEPLPAPDGMGGTTYWDISLLPVAEPDGTVTGLLASLVDATERHKAQQDRSRLFTAVESAGEAVVVTDDRGVIQYANPAFERVTGHRPEDVLGGDLHILDTDEQDETFYADMRAAIEREGVWRGRLTHRKKDGTRYQEDCTISAVRGPNGEISSYISVKRDITEQLRLESLAEAINIADNIGYVFSGIRHEIGNPVNAIRMTLSMLRKKLEGTDQADATGYIQRCLDELGRVQYLLDNLKNFSMFEHPRVAELDLRDFLEKLHSLVRSDLEKKGVAVQLRVEPEAARCRADRRALQQVMLNVITNASEACHGRPDAAVTVSATRSGDDVHVLVADNGAGMTEEEIRNLFRPFHTTKPGGTGLGLVIARRLLNRMGCTIEIQSEKDMGTIVDIRLPSGDSAGMSDSNGS